MAANLMAVVVSVVMPVYNCRQYIAESINSILAQTFTEFEVIIIDDCSTDGTYEYLQSLSDKRIRLIRKEINSGYTISLNMGLSMARGKYIARMDGDDISLPHRFAKQVAFLEENKDVIVLGSGYRIIDSEKCWIPAALTHSDIVAGMLEYSPLAHPSVMLRSSVLKENGISYDHQYEPAEDYKLWTVLHQYGKIANLTDILLLYRQHAAQTSVVRAERQRLITSLIRQELTITISSSDPEFKKHKLLTVINNADDLIQFFKNEASLKKGFDIKGNIQSSRFYKDRLNKILLESMYKQKNRFLFCLSLIPVVLSFFVKIDILFFLKLLVKSLLKKSSDSL